MNKEELHSIVAGRSVEIRFKKLDGSERTIQTIPYHEVPNHNPVAKQGEKEYDTRTLKVYSKHDEGWRTIIVENVIEVKELS